MPGRRTSHGGIKDFTGCGLAELQIPHIVADFSPAVIDKRIEISNTGFRTYKILGALNRVRITRAPSIIVKNHPAFQIFPYYLSSRFNANLAIEQTMWETE